MVVRKRIDMSLINISMPTKDQVVKSVERVVAVFLVTAVGYWAASPHPFSKTAVIGAWLAGTTAIYQAVKSILTTL
jgi:4-amino-4-deoxy-L-arabinose transferase-like glycosyltransferase